MNDQENVCIDFDFLKKLVYVPFCLYECAKIWTCPSEVE